MKADATNMYVTVASAGCDRHRRQGAPDIPQVSRNNSTGKTVTLNGFMQPLRDELSVTGFLAAGIPGRLLVLRNALSPPDLVSVELKRREGVGLQEGGLLRRTAR